MACPANRGWGPDNTLTPARPQMMSPRGVFAQYLQMLPHQQQPRAWQMIESFAMHWQQTGSIAAYHSFPLPGEVTGAAKIFEEHLKSLPSPAAVNAEFEALKGLRPSRIQPLPFLMPDSLPLGDLLQAQPTRKYQRIFRDFEHQQAIKEEYDRLNDKRQATCDDFPNDAEGQHRLVEELFDAILDFSEAEEQQRLLVAKTSKKRKTSEVEEGAGDQELLDLVKDNEQRQWADNTYAKRINAAKDVEIQFVAWNLLRRTRDAQNGMVGIGPWATNWKYNQFDSFRERFNHVKDVCRYEANSFQRSKALVVSMMTADDIFTKRLAAGPLKEIRQKRQNKNTNLLRDRQNKAALHCQRMGWVRTDDTGHLIDAHGDWIDPSPPHRAATKSADGFDASENDPPRQVQGSAWTPPKMGPADYDCPPPGNSSQFLPTPPRTARQPGLPGPAPRTRDFPLGSGADMSSRATSEGSMEPAEYYAQHRNNPVQTQAYPWSHGAFDSANMKQESEDPDESWYLVASRNGNRR